MHLTHSLAVRDVLERPSSLCRECRAASHATKPARRSNDGAVEEIWRRRGGSAIGRAQRDPWKRGKTGQERLPRTDGCSSSRYDGCNSRPLLLLGRPRPHSLLGQLCLRPTREQVGEVRTRPEAGGEVGDLWRPDRPRSPRAGTPRQPFPRRGTTRRRPLSCPWPSWPRAPDATSSASARHRNRSPLPRDALSRPPPGSLLGSRSGSSRGAAASPCGCWPGSPTGTHRGRLRRGAAWRPPHRTLVGRGRGEACDMSCRRHVMYVIGIPTADLVGGRAQTGGQGRLVRVSTVPGTRAAEGRRAESNSRARRRAAASASKQPRNQLEPCRADAAAADSQQRRPCARLRR